MSLDKGAVYENMAAQYLRSQGLNILTSNYRCKVGEIDLIAKEEDSLVFIEVKYRRSSAFGSAEEQVTARKIQKIRRCANYYIQQHKTDSPCRFDVVAITGEQMPQLNWIKNAF